MTSKFEMQSRHWLKCISDHINLHVRIITIFRKHLVNNKVMVKLTFCEKTKQNENIFFWFRSSVKSNWRKEKQRIREERILDKDDFLKSYVEASIFWKWDEIKI